MIIKWLLYPSWTIRELAKVSAMYYRTFAGKSMETFQHSLPADTSEDDIVIIKGAIIAHYYKNNMLIDFRYLNDGEHRKYVGAI